MPSTSIQGYRVSPILIVGGVVILASGIFLAISYWRPWQNTDSGVVVVTATPTADVIPTVSPSVAASPTAVAVGTPTAAQEEEFEYMYPTFDNPANATVHFTRELFVTLPAKWVLGKETYAQGDEGFYTKSILEGDGITTARMAHYTADYTAGRSADIDMLNQSCSLPAEQVSSSEYVTTNQPGITTRVFSARNPLFDGPETSYDYLIGSISIADESNDCVSIVVQPNNSTNRALLVELLKSARNSR
jgi:hypothetical protein